MKQINIKVLHRNIEQRILIYTYYTGEARKEIGVPERLAAKMQASSDDSTQLNDHIGNAITELGNLISRYLAICSIEEIPESNTKDNYKIYLFTLSAPDTFPQAILTRIEKCMETYAVKRALQQWLLQHRPEETAIPASEAQAAALQLREFLTMRQRPEIIL